MTVTFEKLNPAFHMLNIQRPDGSVASVKLHSETYFLHDLCHFVVESMLGLTDGFWGMLSEGYEFDQLTGKTNELTGGLREVEKIVGAVQSRCMGNLTSEAVLASLESNCIEVTAGILDAIVTEINTLSQRWRYLPVGEMIRLVWN